jgi:hypothetical protein
MIDILGITDSTDLEWVRARLRPHPIATFRQAVHAPVLAAKIPSSFIWCRQFGFGQTAERCRQSGWPVHEIDCGHDAMLLKAKELSQLLIASPTQS